MIIADTTIGGENTIIDSYSNGSGTELDDVLDTIEKQQYIAARYEKIIKI